MLLHPLPTSKHSFWQMLKSLFTPKKPELTPDKDQGQKIPKTVNDGDRRTTVFPGSGDF